MGQAGEFESATTQSPIRIQANGSDMSTVRAEAIQVDDITPQVADLCAALGSYLDADSLSQIRAACEFGAIAHAGQYRKSGEPYVTHPIAVAKLLGEVHFDGATLIAAILHDVVEDTNYTKDDIAARFGAEVAELVDGVTKLTQIPSGSRREAQAENFQKMFLAMSKDIRVMMVKLADRLHNMRTLGALTPAKRRRIARETLDIYAPISGRLGMNNLRLQLENLGFRALYPTRYRVLSEAVRRARGNRKEILGQIETRIRDRLEEEGIRARVIGREKHLWGIYQKMRSKHLPFREVYDLYAVRIIVDSVDRCYRVLGAVHNLYKPYLNRFKDYIAIPKANGYQSLHTVLFGPHGVPIEVQIRTGEMHVMAETGVAAHWLYKAPNSAANASQQRARQWLRKVLDMQKRAGDSLEFLDNVRIDLFPDEVYVFTPKGEIVELPRGATAVDFAYAIHSDVGNHCVAARIDRRLSSLKTPLESGKNVEIITANTARPNPSWLSFVVTAKARANIRHYLKNLQQEEALALGKRLLDKSLMALGTQLKEVPEERIRTALPQLRADHMDQVLTDLGLGKRLAPLVARQLSDSEEQPGSTSGEGGQSLIIKGTEGTVVTFGRCCRPIPGDPVVGYLSSGKGIVIHRNTCRNVRDRESEKWMEVGWADKVQTELPVEIRLETNNQKGVLATVAATIAGADSNIENVALDERTGNVTSLTFVISVRDRVHLARVMRRLRSIPQVLKLQRTV